jgi:hypothetical protein
MRCCEYRGGVELCSIVPQSKQHSYDSLNDSWGNRKTHFESFKYEGLGVQPLALRLQDLDGFVIRYSLRELNFDTDTLRAFTGIQKVFEMGNDPVGSLQGLPIPLSEKLSTRELTNALTFSLCWENFAATTVRRRTLLPTWT